jgi:DNA repair and recombination protein RAD54 and RAD54-like protein
MVDFTNPGILGTPEEFRRRILFPILRGREPDATDAQKRKMMEVQADLSGIVEEFILRRINTVNAEHLPPKLVQVVCINLTDIQANMYQHLVTSKDLQHMVDGKQVNCLASIQMLMKLSNHPSLVVEDETKSVGVGRSSTGNRRGNKEKVKYNDDDKKENTAAPGAEDLARYLPAGTGRVHPEWSGKMFVLFRLMHEMRKPYCKDKIVVISNYTQTLDLIGRMCKENNWGFCRLDGSVTMKKRQKMVDDFNDPSSNLVAFLLSSKAGGW